MQVQMVLGYDINRLRKWKEGRAKYGPKFVGNPVIEFYDEQVDSGNYLEEMARQDSLLAADINTLDDMVRATVAFLANMMPDSSQRAFDPACASCGHLWSEHSPEGGCLHACECDEYVEDSGDEFWDLLLRIR
jgi:hypothetical protein